MDEIARVAIHEAGHAVVRFVDSTGGKDLGFVSVVPRSDGTLGFVASAPRERALRSRVQHLEYVRLLLGSRAAGELAYGAEGVSDGCSNDLSAASRIALMLVTEVGLGPSRNLLTAGQPGPEHRIEAEAILAQAYREVLDTLRTHRTVLDRLAARLVERQEMTGDEVRATLSEASASQSTPNRPTAEPVAQVDAIGRPG